MKLKSFSRLVHIGTLDASQKGQRGPSHEGAGLSVSEHPKAWTRIAKLGGLPWWELTRENNRFLDVHALSDTQRASLSQWAVEQGLLQQVIGWQASWYDDELGQEVCLVFDSKAQAEQEAPDWDEESLRIASLPYWQGTAELARRSLRPRAEPFLALAWDLAAMEYADFVGLDGVYWGDELAPECYSAPRAAIVPRQVRHWRFKPLNAPLACVRVPALHSTGLSLSQVFP